MSFTAGAPRISPLVSVAVFALRLLFAGAEVLLGIGAAGDDREMVIVWLACAKVMPTSSRPALIAALIF
jgi:hypothetical protein